MWPVLLNPQAEGRLGAFLVTAETFQDRFDLFIAGSGRGNDGVLKFLQIPRRGNSPVDCE
jgi:hypothetical protein